MKKYIRIKYLKVYGAPVNIHWLALLVVAFLLVTSFKAPITALISIASYLGIFLLHEFGHAYFAIKLGYKIGKINISFVHGQCIYQYGQCMNEVTDNKKDHAIIAWGGVIAQLIVAIPLIFISLIINVKTVYGLGPPVAFLGYISAMFALINLVPVGHFDGASAWKLIPIWLEEKNGNPNKVKRKKSNFKIVK
ncbi:MAG TPA: M50 family peptidase [Gammaproteobacteria bacterium]|nr:M50 family peptidase [Gammaproteobacteria bacterium]